MQTFLNKAYVRFIMRWLACSLGLWISAAVLSKDLSYNNSAIVIVIGGAVLALINILIRPVVVVLSLPAVLFSLGLFMVVINGLMVLLASTLYKPLHVTDFWAAIVAGMIIGLVNYLVTTIVEGL